VPDPQDPATFERSRLEWAELGKEPHASLLAWHRRLIGLRRRYPAFSDPRLDRTSAECDEDAGWLVVRRGPAVIAGNLGEKTWTFPAGQAAVLLAASDPRVELTPHSLVLPPDTVAILADERSAPP
jgi:maltooligosyltrehalose trehalohydrolase